MAVLDYFRPNGDPKDTDRRLSDSEKVKPPKKVEDALKRGRSKMRQGSVKRNECLAFARGDQHVFQGKTGLVLKPTLEADGKQPWRVRQVRNMLKDVIEHEVAAATQRVPSYDVTATTLDPDDVGAALLSEQVALYGYDKWRIRHVTEKVVSFAVIADEGFAFPYFDNQVGDKITDEVATGEVKIRVLGPNEVYWEDGVDFEDSRWHAIETAMPLDQVYGMEGYKGGKLDADAKKSDVLNSKQRGENLVLVTEYFERPSLKKPKGCWYTMANGHQIVPERPYPLVDPSGRYVDEPVLHRLTYFIDPSDERGEGLVRHLLDPQRTINDCHNRLMEWKNLALVPRIFAPKGMFDEGMIVTDEPGGIYEINPIGVATGPTFAPVPQIPRELPEMIQTAQMDIASISAQNQVPSGVEAGKAIEALIEKDQARRQRFIASLAEFHSRLMRHCLYLVQRHYTDPRLLVIRGHFGAARVPDFRGSQLMGQTDVRVSTASVEPRTRESVEQRIMTYAQLGWISPERAMASIRSGQAESVLDDYEYDIQRANLLIQRIRMGAEKMLDEPPVSSVDANGDPIQVPSFMPREFDNAAVQMQVFASWMKSPEYEHMEPPQKEIANLIYGGYKKRLAQQEAEAMAAQEAQAQAQGQSNAARPADAPEQPTMPGGPPPAPQPESPQ